MEAVALGVMMIAGMALAVVLALAAAGVLIYNRLIALRIETDSAWADIDVQLKRRHDLIPNVVETARGYAGHERDTAVWGAMAAGAFLLAFPAMLSFGVGTVTAAAFGTAMIIGSFASAVILGTFALLMPARTKQGPGRGRRRWASSGSWNVWKRPGTAA